MGDHIEESSSLSAESDESSRQLAYELGDLDRYSESIAPKLGRWHLDLMNNGVGDSVLPAIYCMTEHGAEAARQMERLRPYLNWENGRSDDENRKLRDSITSTMKMLSAFCSSNLPIPTASVADENSSLFLNHENLYGDMEIADGKIEYFLKWKEGDQEQEVLDEEVIEGDRVPGKLLVYLYQRLARYK